jgi:hypothetical protein
VAERGKFNAICAAGAPLREALAEELDLVFEFLELAIENAAVFLTARVLYGTADFTGLEFQPLDLRDDFRFGVIDYAHQALHGS